MCRVIELRNCGFVLEASSGLADGIGWDRASNPVVDRMIDQALSTRMKPLKPSPTAATTKKRMLLSGGIRK